MPPVSSATLTSGVTTSTRWSRVAMKSATPEPACVLIASYTSTLPAGRDGTREDVPAADDETFVGAPPGHFAEVRQAAGREHDDVGPLVEDRRRVGFDPKPALYAEPLRLEVEPAHDAGHLLALRRLGREVDLAADLGLLLEQHDLVSALARDPRRLETGGAGADDDDLAPRAGRFLDDVRHRRFAAGRGVLHAQHVEARVLPVDAVIGAHTLLDLVFAAVADLDHEVRIGDLGARHADHVDQPAR